MVTKKVGMFIIPEFHPYNPMGSASGGPDPDTGLKACSREEMTSCKNKVSKALPKHIKEKQHVVHGCRAINAQIAKDLRRATKDWDMWADDPNRSSLETEKHLDSICGCNAFYRETQPLSCEPGFAHRIKTTHGSEEIADFVKTPYDGSYVVIGGIRYESLAYAKRKLQGLLQCSNARHRWEKTKRDLARIEEYERRMKK
jgi:hypothetical protein